MKFPSDAKRTLTAVRDISCATPGASTARRSATTGSSIDIPIDASPDAFRYPDLHVLQRQGVLGRDNSGDAIEILSPRVFRHGARVSFR
jgi:hypothetical protein